jgi:GTP cyclohydrolase I
MDATSEMLSRQRPAISPIRVAARGQGLKEPFVDRRSRAEAEAAVRTLIRWAGDDPTRPGLHETPARVARAYEEWFSGYRQDPEVLLERTFDEIGGYDGPVELRDIPLQSFCEHHMAAIQGKVHIAHLPVDRGVGISKLVRVVEAFARRLQIQERLTGNVATAIDEALQPRGVAVVIEAEHACMTSRGVHSHSTRMVTKHVLGAYRDDAVLRREFFSALGL